MPPEPSSERRWDERAWSDSIVQVSGVVFEDVDEVSLFGAPLPTTFKRLSVVDELKSLNISTANLLREESNNKDRPERIRYFLRMLYTSLYLDPTNETAVADVVKTLFRLIGVMDIPTICIAGPVNLQMGFYVFPCVRPDVVVKSQSGKTVVFCHVEKSSKILDPFPEAQLAAEFFAVSLRNLTVHWNHWDLIGIIAFGSQLTFYRAYIGNQESWEVQNLLRGGQKETPAVVIKRLRIGGVSPSHSFIADSNENMFKTLQCVEAVRTFVNNILGS